MGHFDMDVTRYDHGERKFVLDNGKGELKFPNEVALLDFLRSVGALKEEKKKPMVQEPSVNPVIAAANKVKKIRIEKR